MCAAVSTKVKMLSKFAMKRKKPPEDLASSEPPSPAPAKQAAAPAVPILCAELPERAADPEAKRRQAVLSTGVPSAYCKEAQRFLNDIQRNDLVPAADHSRITSPFLPEEDDGPDVIRIEYGEAIDLLQGARHHQDTNAYRVLRVLNVLL